MGGFPAATHTGGCGNRHGFGSTLRVGIRSFGYGNRNDVPSCSYSFEPHILVNSRMTSSHTSLVTSVLSMSKPVTSRLPAPRPVPNSKRPSLRWSSIATRSATRAGWFTRGFRLKIPEPRWMRSVAHDRYPSTTSLAERCEYSSRKWCSLTQTYFQL